MPLSRKDRYWPMNEIAFTKVLVTASLVTLLISCGPGQESEFDKHEAMERLTKADLVDELIDRANANHLSNRPLDFGLGQAAQPMPSDPEKNLGKAGDRRNLTNYLGSHENFSKLFESAHEGDAEASLRIANLFAEEGKLRNLVLSYMYLMLASTQGATVPKGDLQNLKSQMSSLEIGLAEEALSFCKIEGGIVEGNSIQRVLSACPFRETRAWAMDTQPTDLPQTPR